MTFTCWQKRECCSLFPQCLCLCHQNISIKISLQGGVHIRISESSYTIGDDGRLIIPTGDMSEMGLTARQTVFVAYLAYGGLIKQYQDFVVSATTLSELGVSQQITIPQLLLEHANIGP